MRAGRLGLRFGLLPEWVSTVCSAGVSNILVFMKETRVCVYTHAYGLVLLKLCYLYFCCSFHKSLTDSLRLRGTAALQALLS